MRRRKTTFVTERPEVSVRKGIIRVIGKGKNEAWPLCDFLDFCRDGLQTVADWQASLPAPTPFRNNS